jgi:hypothetical protein
MPHIWFLLYCNACLAAKYRRPSYFGFEPINIGSRIKLKKCYLVIVVVSLDETLHGYVMFVLPSLVTISVFSYVYFPQLLY